jgi:hypothetical protein
MALTNIIKRTINVPIISFLIFMPSHTIAAETVSTEASAPSTRSPALPLKMPEKSFNAARKKSIIIVLRAAADELRNWSSRISTFFQILIKFCCFFSSFLSEFEPARWIYRYKTLFLQIPTFRFDIYLLLSHFLFGSIQSNCRWTPEFGEEAGYNSCTKIHPDHLKL